MGINFKSLLTVPVLALCLGLFTAQADAAMTRYSSNMIGAVMPVKQGIDLTMRSYGVPDQCRKEAHKVLGKYIIYGYDDGADVTASLKVVCHYMPTQADAKRGIPGGLDYVQFKNKVINVERFIMRDANKKAESLECDRKGQCIKMSAGGRSTVLDPSNGPIVKIEPGKLEKVSDGTSGPRSRGGMFAAAYGSMKRLGTVVIAVSVPAVLEGTIRVTSEFGHREKPCSTCSSEHQGIDLGAPNGTNILAYADGQVVNSYKSDSGGNMIVIRHADGTFTQYMHMQSASTYKKGDMVKAGAVIGQVGSTGHSTGNHLHFGVYKLGADGKPDFLDPLTMQPPTGAVTALNDTQLNALSTQIADIDRLSAEAEGGVGEFIENAQCENGVTSCDEACRRLCSSM